jgi:peptide alpha-N-acetyltransferase
MPETLAIKALIIHSSLPHNHPTATSQPKGEEADHLIKVALAKDPYSHITHHVQSIMARANKDWETAYKALTRAREIDPDNIPLIRDSISLLTHMRKYDEAIEVRHRLFLLRPAGRSAWIGLAVGHELAGDFDEAIRILEGLKDLTKSEGDGGLTAEIEKRNFELWLMSLYVRAGKFAEALEKLEDDFRDRILTNQGEASELHGADDVGKICLHRRY